jgi:hypothetical protein
MRTVNDLRNGGTQDERFFARKFIRAHNKNLQKAEECWKRQYDELMIHAKELNEVPYSKREEWVTDKAMWLLLPAAMNRRCRAPRGPQE